jgi:hypothetical protein
MDEVGESENGFGRENVSSGGREEEEPVEEVVAKLCRVRSCEDALDAYGCGGAFAMLGSTIPSMSSRFMSKWKPPFSEKGDIMPSDSMPVSGDDSDIVGAYDVADTRELLEPRDARWSISAGHIESSPVVLRLSRPNSPFLCSLLPVLAKLSLLCLGTAVLPPLYGASLAFRVDICGIADRVLTDSDESRV